MARVLASPATSVYGATLPNAKGELPPDKQLNSEVFEDYASRTVKRKNYPPDVYTITATRLFKGLPTGGKFNNPTDFLLWVLEAVKFVFSCSPAILQALFSGRLGSRGASVMMFVERLESEVLAAGLSNANFDVSFAVGADLGVNPPCRS